MWHLGTWDSAGFGFGGNGWILSQRTLPASTIPCGGHGQPCPSPGDAQLSSALLPVPLGLPALGVGPCPWGRDPAGPPCSSSSVRHRSAPSVPAAASLQCHQCQPPHPSPCPRGPGGRAGADFGDRAEGSPPSCTPGVSGCAQAGTGAVPVSPVSRCGHGGAVRAVPAPRCVTRPAHAGTAPGVALGTRRGPAASRGHEGEGDLRAGGQLHVPGDRGEHPARPGRGRRGPQAAAGDHQEGGRGAQGHPHHPPPLFGTIRVRCLFTPCHTSGHMCYFMWEDNSPDAPALFSGDTLFVGGCGQFFEGTAEQMHTNLTQILGTLPKDTKIFCGHECTVRNLKFALKVEPENEVVKEKLAWAKQRDDEDLPTVPSTLQEEFLYNPFLRVTEEAVQRFTGRTDPVEVLRALRSHRDNFKKPKERPNPQAMLAFHWGLFGPFLEKK
ncbi:hydroxyacylglutathione hydrolase-like protein isoform X2 [Agelaius phoeniceus]|uniref:hydroxyacylglutathione hydrolase-like protein isoform X2 n=1 Tax=Agelaius phoeniceus TaxID=39638 RepID=UPI0040550A35